METRFNMFKVNSDRYEMLVSNNYYSITEGKEIYHKSKLEEEAIDSTIFIECKQEGSEDVTHFTIGADDAEQVAITLLNIANSVKR